MAIRKFAIAAVLSAALASAPVHGGEYREEGWPVPDLIWYNQNSDYHFFDMDGDRRKETWVDIFENFYGKQIAMYRTKNRHWAYTKISNTGSLEGETVVDSKCTGVFDMRYGEDELIPLPECLKGLNNLEK